jgi:hypothetical protein
MNITDLAERVRAALEAADLDAYQDLLAQGVHWGPPDQPELGCHNRREVLAWYKVARADGVRAKVDEVVPGTDCLLVGLTVSGNPASAERGGPVSRWQVLTVNDGLIVDICGFDDRDQAAARAGIPA